MVNNKWREDPAPAKTLVCGDHTQVDPVRDGWTGSFNR
jgi:predicted nucleic acid-binding Zn ribbon protein